MRALCISVFAAAAVAAQGTSTYTTTQVDINGQTVQLGPRVSTTTSGNTTDTVQTNRSINGRNVTVERVEERVLRDDASGKTIERIVHRYDETGNPAGTEKIVVDEQKRAGGGSSIQTTSYQNDINGRMAVVSRATTQTQVSGGTETADTVVEKPDINGGFETVEKQNVVTSRQGKDYNEEAVTYRRNENGDFYPAVRRVTDHNQAGNVSKDNTAEYEVGADGRMALHSQKMATTEKGPGGAENVQVDIFRKNVPGISSDSGSLQLIERQLIDRRLQPGGATVETLSVQRPSISDPRKLGPPQQLSETVCHGACSNLP